jgi:Uroporphyrinogen decarboxylase (URO-D)
MVGTGEQVKSITEEPKYAAAIKNWEALWALEDIGRPLWLFPTSASIMALGTGMASLPQLVQDKVVQLQTELAVLDWRDSVGIDDDYIPQLQPYGGVTVFASAFGCEVEYFGHTLPWAHPVIRPEDPPEKVYELEPPAVTDGQLGQMLEFTDYFVTETKGRYPISVTDMQGPLDTAYLVWESSAFMTAMYTNPKEVHHLMRMVTDLIVRYVKEQRARSPQFNPCHYPPFWLPDGRGISISDDGLAVISTKLYEEFCLPYVNELSEEFGGIMIHSCGNFVHQFDNLRKVHNLRGINFGASETPFEAVWERFNGKTAIIPHLGLNNQSGDIHFHSNREYMEHVLQVKTHNRGLGLISIPGPKDFADPSALTKFVERSKATLAKYSSTPAPVPPGAGATRHPVS